VVVRNGLVEDSSSKAITDWSISSSSSCSSSYRLLGLLSSSRTVNQLVRANRRRNLKLSPQSVSLISTISLIFGCGGENVLIRLVDLVRNAVNVSLSLTCHVTVGFLI